MIEPYQWIKQNAEFLGINPDNINPASVDLCLGGHIIEITPEGVRYELNYDPEENLWRLQDGSLALLGKAFEFKAGHFYIAHSVEYTRVPDTHAWMLMLKSSTGRKGLDHLHAGWGDPGFHGQVTFEFQALQNVVFGVGQRIVQLVYMRLTEPTERPYTQTGRYNGQTGATLAKEDQK